MLQETTAQIEARLIALLQSDPALYDPTNPDTSKRGLTSVSNVAKWRVFLNTIATEIFTLQQLMGLFETEVEGIINGFAPAVESWIQKKVFEFQYSATTPQVLVLTDFLPAYPTVDETLRIITQCSVKTDLNKVVKIKVATGGATPVPIGASQKTALKAYLDIELPAGVGKNVISLVSDKLYINANVYYNGQYAPTIQSDVLAALNSFLAGTNANHPLAFDGIIEISELEDVIQDVAGVKDVVINQVKARDDNTAFGSASVVTKQWESFAGYIVEETTAGQTFSDTITFEVQN